PEPGLLRTAFAQPLSLRHRRDSALKLQDQSPDKQTTVPRSNQAQRKTLRAFAVRGLDIPALLQAHGSPFLPVCVRAQFARRRFRASTVRADSAIASPVPLCRLQTAAGSRLRHYGELFQFRLLLLIRR